MACRFELCLNAGQYPNQTQAALEALERVERLEAQLSYFRPDSELSRLNRAAADGPVEVEPRLFELLSLALDLSHQTGGAFDITSTPLWEAWGFARRAGRIPTDAELGDAMQRVGSGLVELDRVRKTVRFRRAGVRVDLGALGKGYALDRAAEGLAAAAVADYLFHAGQSSILAQGSRVGPPGSLADGWSIGVRHPLRPGRRLGEIRLCNRGLGTSAATLQFFRHKGRRYGHILDPRTGQPAQGVLSVTVIAPSATLADALSTAFYVMGPDQTAAFCRARPELAALLVCPEPSGRGCRVHSFGFGRNELTLFED